MHEARPLAEALAGTGGDEIMQMHVEAEVSADYDGDGKADLSVMGVYDTWNIDFAANDFGNWDDKFNLNCVFLL